MPTSRCRWASVSALALAGVLASTPCAAQGLSARFGHVRAIEGERLTVRIELDDPSCGLGGATPCLIDAVHRVLVDVRTHATSEWHTRDAEREAKGEWWQATFTSTVVPTRREGGKPARIDIRARVLGARGGLLLELGDDEPLEVEVLTAPEARKLDRALSSVPGGGEKGEFSLIGYVGAEGRAGSSARARLLIGVGGRAGAHAEILVHVAVGPAFARPSLLDGGGPLVLGFDGGVRLFTRDPASALFSLFVEPFGSADLRFPGLDPGVGLRAGALWNLSADVAVEAALGGSLVLFRAIDREDRSSSAGASGGLRVALRLGGGSAAGD